LLALRPRPAAALSVRGRGKSDAPAAGYRWEDHIGDLEAVVARLGWSQMSVVAFSRGSSYALGFSLRHPEAVRALVVGDYEARHIGLPPSFVEYSMATEWRGLPMRSRMPEHAVRAVQEESVEVPLWDRLAELACPILLLRPGRRALLKDETVARWSDAARRLTTVDLAGASHDLWGSDPQGVLDALRPFLDQAEAFPSG
jgi:pimeloyl-ACP methyl ester carboxylesterase